ncbi:leucine-rich repeat domain-containing protein [Kineothrix sp. MSJ-39]|uniref:leucine-rich repeat protein n=1 Tax=Kineothrix sp. MSJ-39 TaxID=2841533 RepID=UPI001C11C643|nr:leucine-rich repeat protein [Kineothrix sp. MSJ-39]MBU5430279.1 leucine-rich repeat domain-containing protein [Kineothrix sp. MSJ-39]
MFKSLKKVLVGVLASSLILSSVAFAADTTAVKSPTTPVKVTVVTKKTVSKAPAKKAVKFSKSVKTIKAGAINKKTTTITFAAKSKTTVKKGAFKNAKNLKTITVSGNKVKFEKNAFKGLTKKQQKKITINVKGLSKSAFNKYKKALQKAGFKGTIKRVK